MLSFEVLEDGEKIQILCDKEGLAALLENLGYLVRTGDHVHLRGPSGGGSVLSETTPFGGRAVSEVIIDFNPNYD